MTAAEVPVPAPAGASEWIVTSSRRSRGTFMYAIAASRRGWGPQGGASCRTSYRSPKFSAWMTRGAAASLAGWIATWTSA